MPDISHQKLNQILDAQNQALGLVVSDAPLTDCLNQICLLLEKSIQNKDIIVGISIQKDDFFNHRICPSLPEVCSLSIQRESSPCTTLQSILKNQPVFSQNISTTEHWICGQQVLQKAGIKACGSWPISITENEVYGSLDIYLKSHMEPNRFEVALTQHYAQFVAVTIEKNQLHKKQKSLTQSIQDSNHRMKAFSKLIPDLMFVLNHDGTIENLLGGSPDLLMMAESEFIDKKYNEVLPPDVSTKVEHGITQALDNNKIQVIEYSLDLPIGKTDFEGRIIPAEQDRDTHERRLLYMARDVTQQNKDKAQIEELAYYDSLTQLANRSYLMERLEEKIQLVARNQLHGALIFVDLDDFKKINDSLGHSIGDEFLIMIGLRLKQVIPLNAALARIGGDEFVILLDDLSIDAEQLKSHAVALSEMLIKQVSKSFFYNKAEYQIGCSIGISIFDGNQAATADQVLQQADMCMYQAKKMGGKQLVVFDQQFSDNTAQRFKIESDIQKGIKNHSFHAYFQPQFNHHNQIISAEALIRWQVGGKTVVQPSEFIPIAENSGLINQLQQIILKQSCQLIQQIDCLLGHQDFTLSINISTTQLRTKLGQMLLQTIMEHGLEPRRFKLEITESILLDRSQVVSEQIEVLQSMGFQFSIDDFGMGFSSLAYLHDLPIQELKIDKAFIEQRTNHKKQRAIVKAITTLANELDLNVIIEGVETTQQHQLIEGLNYTALQGFLFAKPMPISEFMALMKQTANTVI
ncbi:sensor domain-containing phosphodiesterase [Marinicella rhabdoformis]|uniref:sensor domain-containing phosphodiesterase n=1 Tax=Marinicella rhabdoformis TaxID=2580566 RepID=UPI0012AED9F3|nr:EAL domain-containing protein [Marinicella rhabdoformis]